LLLYLFYFSLQDDDDDGVKLPRIKGSNEDAYDSKWGDQDDPISISTHKVTKSKFTITMSDGEVIDVPKDKDIIDAIDEYYSG
jgi:hypothetical protein